jgi:hypothetical protein
MSYVLARQESPVDSSGTALVNRPLARHGARLAPLDIALICVFLLGIYTNYTIGISAKVPFPSVPSGIAGMILFWRRRDQISPRALGGLAGVVALYVISIVCAANWNFLPRRFNGLIQLSYSLTIGYALYLTVMLGSRRQMAALFLTFSLVILTGCLLEDYGGLRSISDSVRTILYTRGIYENDLRDLLLYRRIRPKFFASEPASVTFCFSLFTFVWMVMSEWRFKIPLYVALVGAGLVAMPGPTLLLMLLLILPYMLFLDSRRDGRLNVVRVFRVCCMAAIFLVAFVVLGKALFSERLRELSEGNDPSFFYRVQGPALAAVDTLKDHPIAGAGLTGEPFIEQRIVNEYLRSPAYSERWGTVHPSTELVINYFWLHWIYLGIFWGAAIAIAITIWLEIIGVPSPAFCWIVWAILGQASGAYVGPLCWAVMFLTGAGAALQQRKPA